MYPRLEVDIEKLIHNARVVSDICKENNMTIAMVTKVYCAMEEVVEEIVNEGVIDYIADSRIQNLKKLSNIEIPKILIRIPMLSEVEDVIRYSDISFNSELKTIYKLNEEAKAQDKIHDVVVMVDLGDLREGYFEESELLNAIDEIIKLENIKLRGIATNLTCYGAIIPTKENLSKLEDLAKFIESKYNIHLDFVSGGNSSSIHLLQKNEMPEKISNLRPGEAIVLGRETAYGEKIGKTHQDVFKLIGEIVEIKEKPSIPIGEVGMDAFGNVPVYEDNGIRKRAIVGIGKQDIDISSIFPVKEEINILGASSDHMILDITDFDYEVGDTVEFLLDYGGVMSASTSEYVHKKVVNKMQPSL